MNIQISPDIWFNTTSLFQSTQLSCERTNGLVCTKIDPTMEEAIDASTYVNLNFSSGALRSQIVETSLSSINQSQSSSSVNSTEELQSKVLETAYTGKLTSSLIDLALAEKGIGININITV